jgi:hypothetical protein
MAPGKFHVCTVETPEAEIEYVQLISEAVAFAPYRFVITACLYLTATITSRYINEWRSLQLRVVY